MERESGEPGVDLCGVLVSGYELEVRDGHTHCGDGTKPEPMVGVDGTLCTLFMLLTLENERLFAGSLPLAFSDIPLSCVGTVSSIDEDLEGVFEGRCHDCDATCASCSSSSGSSSSPMAKLPLSSGTSLRLGLLTLVGLRTLSIEV